MFYIFKYNYNYIYKQICRFLYKNMFYIFKYNYNYIYK